MEPVRQNFRPWRTHYQGRPRRDPYTPDTAARMVLMATFDPGEHVCACAVLGENAPCGHCTGCPVCNCARCEDWHDTAGGEVCPHAEPEE